MAVGNADPEACAARAAAMTTGHVRGSPCLVDEDKPLGIKIELAIEPSLAPHQDVGAVLFRGMSCSEAWAVFFCA